jgi:enoyl-[acyl-carrier protein] reductase II
LDLPAAFFNARAIAVQMRLPFWKLFIGVLASGWKTAKQLAYFANAFKSLRIATEDGDMKTGVIPVGQATGLIHDEPSVDELMARIVAEAHAAQGSLTRSLE